MSTITLRVTGERPMHCAGCEKAVKNALARVPGVAQAEASHQTQLIQVTYDSQRASVEDLKAALLKAGYQASVA